MLACKHLISEQIFCLYLIKSCFRLLLFKYDHRTILNKNLNPIAENCYVLVDNFPNHCVKTNFYVLYLLYNMYNVYIIYVMIYYVYYIISCLKGRGGGGYKPD